jgi:hypothetical protein
VPTRRTARLPQRQRLPRADDQPDGILSECKRITDVPLSGCESGGEGRIVVEKREVPTDGRSVVVEAYEYACDTIPSPV